MTCHMNTVKEMSRLLYTSPEAESVEIELNDLFAVSGDNVTVDDPWDDNVETEW